MLALYLLGNFLNQGAHLDGCTPIDLHLHFLTRFILVQQLSKVSVVLLHDALLLLQFSMILLLLFLEVVLIVFLGTLLINGRLDLFLSIEVAAS